MKLVIRENSNLKSNSYLYRTGGTPTANSSRSKSKGKKSLEVTCNKRPSIKPKIQIQAPEKFHKLLAQTPQQRKRTYVDDIVSKFGTAQTARSKTSKTLLQMPDLVEYNSMTTMDSFQMKRSKVSYLWGCDSPVNQLVELQQSDGQKWFDKFFK